MVSVKAAMWQGGDSPKTTWGKWRVRGCGDEEGRPGQQGEREQQRTMLAPEGDFSLNYKEATWCLGVSL